MITVQLKHLEYFITVAECGSINQAARRLFLSPQALSAAIAGLERELAFPLFERQRQGVRLTAEGARVLEGAGKILNITEEWAALGTENAQEAPAGEVTVQVSLALSTSFNRFLIELEKKYPKLSIIVNEGRGKNIIERLQKKPSGLAICSLVDEIYAEYLPVIQQNQWEVNCLMEDEFAVVLGRDYFPEIQEALTLEDCAKMRLICSSDANDIIGRRYFTMFGGNLTSRVESHASILYMVEQNKGAIILPRRIARCEPMYEAGLLRILPIQGVRLKTSHYLIRPKRCHLSPAVKAVMASIQDYYARAEWEKA